MKLKSTVLAAALAVAGAQAFAQTAWGDHAAFEFGSGFAVGGGTLLSDSFTFTLTAPSVLLTTAVSNDAGWLDLVDGLISLYSASGTLLSSFSFDSVPTASAPIELSGGDYYYVVSAQVSALALAGSYTFTSQISPVPEPETYALFLAGLGAVGFMVSRRRNGG